jgi:hypothetical protein
MWWWLNGEAYLSDVTVKLSTLDEGLELPSGSSSTSAPWGPILEQRKRKMIQAYG